MALLKVRSQKSEVRSQGRINCLGFINNSTYLLTNAEIMKFLEVDNPAIANHSCLIDGLIDQRAFTLESVDINQQMKLLALMLSTYLNTV